MASRADEPGCWPCRHSHAISKACASTPSSKSGQIRRSRHRPLAGMGCGCARVTKHSVTATAKKARTRGNSGWHGEGLAYSEGRELYSDFGSARAREIWRDSDGPTSLSGAGPTPCSDERSRALMTGSGLTGTAPIVDAPAACGPTSPPRPTDRPGWVHRDGWAAAPEEEPPAPVPLRAVGWWPGPGLADKARLALVRRLANDQRIKEHFAA